MSNITRVIKDLIEANTLAELQEISASNRGIITSPQIIYTDENFSNTSNTFIANTENYGHIKIFGYGFRPNTNVFVTHSTVDDNLFLLKSNTFYVNFRELRLEINNSDLSNNFHLNVINEDIKTFNLIVGNDNGTNSFRYKSINIEPLRTEHAWTGGGASIGPAVSPSPAATTSNVNRFTFVSDTNSFIFRTTINEGKNSHAATGNDNFGWFSAGTNPAPAVSSSTSRLTFSSDTSSSSSRGPLSLARTLIDAVSTDNFGWIGGGVVPGTPSINHSRVDRIDFNSDTGVSSIRGTIPLARHSLAATGNQDFGWFGGGAITTAPGTITLNSNIQRISFVNDSVAASTRGPLFTAKRNHTATGNISYGWFGGGIIPATVSTIERIDFSSDTVVATERSNLSIARYNISSTSNEEYGWFIGGFPTPTSFTVDKISFIDDTVTASVRGTLNEGLYSSAVTSGLK